MPRIQGQHLVQRLVAQAAEHDGRRTDGVGLQGGGQGGQAVGVVPAVQNELGRQVRRSVHLLHAAGNEGPGEGLAAGALKNRQAQTLRKDMEGGQGRAGV
jgi:hypothetical protein